MVNNDKKILMDTTLKELIELSATMNKENEKVSNVQVFYIGMIHRMTELISAIRVLYNNQMVYPMMPICRLILEYYVYIQYLHQDESTHFDELVKISKRLHSEIGKSLNPEVKKTDQGKKIKDLFLAIGPEREYNITYRYFSLYSHASLESIESSFNVSNNVISLDRSDIDADLQCVAMISIYYESLKTVLSVFNESIPERLQKQCKAFENEYFENDDLENNITDITSEM